MQLFISRINAYALQTTGSRRSSAGCPIVSETRGNPEHSTVSARSRGERP